VSAFPLKLFTSPGGSLAVEVISSRVVSTKMAGFLDLGLASLLVASLHECVTLGGGHLIAFHDWESITDYDTDVRALLAPWSKLHRSEFDCVHLLVQSRTLAWGIRIVTGVAGGTLIAHRSRTSFEQAYRAAC
jgi:hypothetical protein